MGKGSGQGGRIQPGALLREGFGQGGMMDRSFEESGGVELGSHTGFRSSGRIRPLCEISAPVVRPAGLEKGRG